MNEAVIFATGSAVTADVEESLHRAGITLKAGVRNRPGPCWLSDPGLIRETDTLDAASLALPFIVPLFTPANRQRAVEEARRLGFSKAITLVDPTAVLPRQLTLGEGGYIGAGVTIGAAAYFGSFAFLNRSASIGHHFEGGDYLSVGPGATIAGQVKAGSHVLIGAGAVILPKVEIGDGAVIGAGAVVVHDVAAGQTVVGNPARIREK